MAKPKKIIDQLHLRGDKAEQARKNKYFGIGGIAQGRTIESEPTYEKAQAELAEIKAKVKKPAKKKTPTKKSVKK